MALRCISKIRFITDYQTIISNMLDTKDAEIDAQIDLITEDRQLSPQQRQKRVSLLRSSRLSGTDSSTQTVISLVNTMIGSAIVLYPVLFVKDGMIGSTLIMITMGCIQFFTCRLLIVHSRPDQTTYNQQILRICGLKMDKINSISNCLLLFVVSIAYFLLIVTHFFQVSAALVQALSSSYKPPQKLPVNFGSYSIQWSCIICTLLCFPTIMMRKIQPILKLVKYSAYFVMAYVIFVFCCLIKQIATGKIDFNNYKLFDSDFSTVAGAFALSFLIHSTAAPILKRNVNRSNNERDLLWGYVLTAIVYFYVGFIGGLACAQESYNISHDIGRYDTIFDCVARHDTTPQKIFYAIGKIIQSGTLFQNYSVLPVLFYLTRKQAIALSNRPSIFVGFSVFFLLLSCLIGIFQLDVSILISFAGAIIGFFIGYFIPIYTHLKCYHYKYSQKENKQRRSLLTGTVEDDLIGQMQLYSQTQAQILKCNDHPKKNKKTHLMIYGPLLLVGVALGIFKISSAISS